MRTPYDGGDRVRQVGESPRGGLLLPGGGVAVAREEHALVGADEPLEELLQVGVEVARHGVQLVGERVERLGDDRIQHHLVLGAVLGGARRAELELVAGEGERGGAVAVGRVARKRRQRVHADLQLRASARGPGGSRLDGLHHGVQLVAEEDGEDGGRRLVRAEAMVVAGAGGGRAQEVGVQVDRADDGQQHGEEDRVLLRVRARLQQVAPAVGDGPVAVLAAAVDAGERLLVQQALHAVALGRAAQDLHDEHVVVHGEVELLEDRRKLELRGRDLVVARLRGDAELPELRLHLGHELQDARTNRAVVMVVQLLVLRGRRAEHRTAGLEEVGALQVEAAVDEEVFLLRAERHGDVRVRLAEVRHQALQGLREGLDGAQERRLGVERLAGVGAERRRDAERRAVRVPLDERGAGGVPRRVAARLERRAQAAGREGRRVRLAADQVLAAEGLDRARGTGRLDEAVVLLRRAAGERLEPVREVRRALGERPLLHGVRHVGGDGGIERLAVVDGGQQLGGGGLRQEGAHFLLAEHVLAVRRERRVRRQGRRRRVGGTLGDRVEDVDAVVLAHGALVYHNSSPPPCVPRCDGV